MLALHVGQLELATAGVVRLRVRVGRSKLRERHRLVRGDQP